MTFWRLKSLQEIIIYTFKNTLFWKPCFETLCFGNPVLGHPVFEALFWDNLFTKFEKLLDRPGLGYTKLIACIEFGTSIEYKYTPGNCFLKKIEKSKLVTVFTILEFLLMRQFYSNILYCLILKFSHILGNNLQKIARNIT